MTFRETTAVYRYGGRRRSCTSTQEYKCEKCRTEFSEQETCGPQPTSDAKCPMCGSMKVRELTESERLFKKALGLMRGG